MKKDKQDFPTDYRGPAQMIEVQEDVPAAFLAIVLRKEETDHQAEQRGQELLSLVTTMGLKSVGYMFIPIRSANSATLIGSGKVTELFEEASNTGAGIIIFDCDLNPRVQRNLEQATGLCVIDRQEVILQIFANRAQTKEAKLQIELARLEYSLPRLTRAWTNLSRQHGGVKGTKGEGETQLELDRRIVQAKISQIKKELQKVKTQRNSQRKQRMEHQVPNVAIVGYTNSGKSSLLRRLTGADVLVEFKLFATLDTTSKQVNLPDGNRIILTDTVGFVSDLPHQLVESFKSTLEEATYADALLIVCDASHPDMLGCYETTRQVLEELGCKDKPTVTLINKMDAVEDTFSISRLKSMVPDALEVSVKQDKDMTKVLDALEDVCYGNLPLVTYVIPAEKQDLIAYLHRTAKIEDIEYADSTVTLSCRIKPCHEGPVKQFHQQ
jgi:GTP-binding protein HflX